MSEFKYACPVCGQHIKCDSSQAGTIMDCPTCFQKIIAPQAPADESQKLILTGTKVSERVTPVSAAAPPTAAPAKKFPGVLVVVLILAFMGAAAAAVYWTTILHPRHAAGDNIKLAVTTTNSKPVKPKPPEKPALVAPPANDTNWMLMLADDDIPGTPVAGRIHGQDFISDRSSFQNGTLTLRSAARGTDAAAVINFSGMAPELLSGKIINVMTNAQKAARVTLRWKDSMGEPQKTNYNDSYALRLEFGTFTNNHLPGKIYFCAPDLEKSYVLGAFNADARKPKPKTPKP